jgi:predicted GIY-YIG superfamily endonuclease
VYLLCFRDPATGQHAPLRGNGCRGQYAGHYWGWTDDLIRRISQHRNPRWRGAGRLVQVALEAGLSFELAWLEYPATRGRERRLKNQGSAYRRCPLCRGTGGPLDPVAAVAAVQSSALPQPRSAKRR